MPPAALCHTTPSSHLVYPETCRRFVEYLQPVCNNKQQTLLTVSI